MKLKEALMVSEDYYSCMEKLTDKDRVKLVNKLINYINQTGQTHITDISFGKASDTYPWFREGETLKINHKRNI